MTGQLFGHIQAAVGRQPLRQGGAEAGAALTAREY